MSLESPTRVHRASKSSRDPKIVGYNPRKRPEMAEITNFSDASRVVYQGTPGMEILPWPKIVGYNTRKGPEMLKITSFADTARVVY